MNAYTNIPSVKKRDHSKCIGCLQVLSFIIFDPFIDLFITLCIVVNTLFMALDHHDMDPGMESTLKNGNYVRYQLFYRKP